MDYPSTRKEAQHTGAMYYFTGLPCKYGHIAPRKTKGACIECLKVEWTKSNESRAEYFKQYNHREEVKDRKNEWYEANKEQVMDAARTCPIEIKREYQKAWKERNLIWVRADTKARRRKHREATPKWLTKIRACTAPIWGTCVSENW